MDPRKEQELSTLLLRAQEGDAPAYEAFLKAVSLVLRKYLARRMTETEMIDDVLQDALLSIHRARHTFLKGRLLGPWVYAICAHRLTDFYRKYRRIQQRELLKSDELDSLIDLNQQRSGSNASAEETSSVTELLNSLPESQRTVIKLLKLEALSVKEVAAKLAMSESAVKVTAFRGYEEIRRALGLKKK